MCLGLPTVVISIAENQRTASEALAKVQLVQYAGHFSDMNIETLSQLLRQFSHDAERLAGLSIQNQLQVDGFGALRLAEVLCPSASNDIRLRPACEDDMIFYYNWANDPEVRKHSFDTTTITWAMHHAWFASKLHDVKSHLYVLEIATLPVGQIRFDKEADEASIDYSLDTIVRGRGWGSRLVAMGADLMQKIESLRLRALVKSRNEVSCSVFLHLGFTEELGLLKESVVECRSFFCDPVCSGKLEE
jgi:RimJ/RimL family protein N-acetyltransferase